MLQHRIDRLESVVDNLIDRVRALECCQPSECCCPDDGPFAIEVGEYVTRSGRKAVVYTTEGLDPEYPVVGEVVEEDGISNHCWTWDGFYDASRIPFHLDLFEA